MYCRMDMGTSNTRLWLSDGQGVLASKRAPFGARCGRLEGREVLFAKLKTLLQELLREASVMERDVECILVSGMAGSEIGLCEIDHIALPANVYRLADSLVTKTLDAITSIPFVFVPGLKKCNVEEVVDVMRGEETETVGILSRVSVKEDAVLVLPGTHNKIVLVNREGEITDFYTTLSGELLDVVASSTILSGQVTHAFEVDDRAVLRGAAYAEQQGLNAALFHVRVMARNGEDLHACSSFLYGAVIGEDAALIRRVAGEKRIYVGGRETLRRVYTLLLGMANVSPLDESVAAEAVSCGLAELYGLNAARQKRAAALASIERERLISIVRGPKKESFLRAMKALYDGGVRLAEVTFDRSGKISREETAEFIRSLADAYKGEMFVGAGTVTSTEDVMAAYRAGASFIISPNCDPEVISLTRKLGLVSIPSAFTPTEIALALKHGADYVKLFPADQAGEGYVKAVKAPLSDAKLLAVGGVNERNAGDFLKKGFCGVGVGSNLYNHALIDSESFDALEALARQFVEAVK